MTSSMLRRQLKNLVQNYSEAEVKVREATSNDPWGPSSSQMADISDLTYNAVACSEIMTMLWKRLKDDKNWRHIHKSLTLLEYLLKTGDDRVLLKMKENIYIVKALTEYRFVEKDGKDQGVNVREKAKVVLVLMEDDEKLKAEREFAVKTREKTSKGSAASSTDNIKDPNYKPVYVAGASGLPCLDNIPSVADLTASFAARKEERLRQDAEKKDAERRAKMSEDELKWEDAGKADNTKSDAWAGEKEEEEEVKTDPWGAPKEPSTDPWGVAKTEDPFVAEKTDEDPFTAPKDKPDPFNAPKDTEDPFTAPKDKPDPFSSSNGDPFVAPKDDPFNAPKDDPFNAPKDDPFNAPKDDPFHAPKDDPFVAPTDDPFYAPKDDPFVAPKDDPFHAPKDDPFVAPKDDPFVAPKDDPFVAPKDDPFSAPKDDPFKPPKGDPFSAPQNDPFSAPKDNQFSASKETSKEDPFNAPKDDLFGAPKNDPFEASKDHPFTLKDDPFSVPANDPFTAPVSTPPKEEPLAEPTLPKADSFTGPTTPPKVAFSSPTEPPQNDHFAAPTTPTKEVPFSTMSKATKEDPFAAPTTPSTEDPFTVPYSPPTEASSDPFIAPTVGSPQETAGHASSPPAKGSDAWGAPCASKETMGGDPWGDGSLPLDDSDPFGDASKPDDDPWGAPGSAPVASDDAWGTSAPPSDSSPSGDPFGDGSSKDNDPWGAPSNASGNASGKHTAKEEEIRRKTASFLGPTGVSLVDLDDLFAPNPKAKQPLINMLAAQTQSIGTFKGQISGPSARSGAFAETLAPNYNPFGSSLAPTHGAIHSAFGAASPSAENLQFKEPLYALETPHSSAHVLHAAQDAPAFGIATPVTQWGVGMLHFEYNVGNILGTGDAPSSFFGVHSPDVNPFISVSPQTKSEDTISSEPNEMMNNNTNPFLF